MIADLAALRREAEQLAESLEKDYGYRLWASIVRRLLEALTEMEQEAANWQDAYDQDHAAMIAGDEQIVELDKERSRLEASLLALRGYVQHKDDCELINTYTPNGKGEWLNKLGEVTESVRCTCGLSDLLR